jgi:hypothetical protein
MYTALYQCVIRRFVYIGHIVGPEVEHVIVGAVMFAALFTVVNVIMIRVRNGAKVNLHGCGILFGHCLGFAAIDLFGNLQTLSLAKKSMGAQIGTLLCIAVVLFIVFRLGDKLRVMLIQRLDHSEQLTHDEEEFEEVLEEMEEETFAFGLGFCISMVCRAFLTGEMPSTHGDPYHRDEYVAGLFGFALFFFSIFMGFSCLRESQYRTCLPRCNIRSTFQMAFVWNVLYAGQWFYFSIYEKASIELGICVVAFAMTAFSYIGIFGADMLQRSTLIQSYTVDRLMNTIGVCVGLAWEKAFHVAIVTVSGAALESNWTEILVHDHDTATLVFTVVQCMIVLPAWWWYLLPAYLHAADLAEEHEQHEAHKDLEEELHLAEFDE